jgi:hypothetical protein
LRELSVSKTLLLLAHKYCTLAYLVLELCKNLDFETQAAYHAREEVQAAVEQQCSI